MGKQYSISQIRKAGKKLRNEELGDEDRAKYLDILAYWRAQHHIPLNTAVADLKQVSEGIDKHSIIAAREKRATSIVEKLKRERSMSLALMQDIGGCRVIVTRQKDADKINKALRKKKHITLSNNYVKNPKSDGYRGHHFVGRYDTKEYDNLPIEFQVRTKIQHAWATAGEITELFASTPIKNLYGDKEWKEFYRLAADCFAIVDDRYIERDMDPKAFDVKNAAQILRERHGNEIRSISKELKRRSRELNVHKKFSVFRSSLNHTVAQVRSGNYCVLHAKNLRSGTPSVTIRTCESVDDARRINFEVERMITNNTDELVVMLSVNDMVSLEEAYPNYFADSEYFLRLLSAVEGI